MSTPAPLNIKNKTFDLNIDNKNYILKLEIQQNYLNFELETNELGNFQKNYSNKLTKENLEKISILFLDKETQIDDCFQIISDLIESKKINIKKAELDKIKLIFSPKIFMIKDFEIELKEIKLTQKQINDILFKKIEELEEKIKYLNNKVLLISKDKKKSILYKLLKKNSCINKICVFEPNILQDLTENILSKYKILIYDICNCGFGRTKNKDEIKNFVSKGGNIIVTHDHWTYLGNGCLETNGCSELLGAKLVQQSYAHVTKAKIIKKEHPIFTKFYDLSSENSNINVCDTHKTDTFYNNIDEYNRDLLIELEDGKHGEYLLIKEIERGKIIFWNVGESDINEFEKKLFINCLSWICEQ